MDRIGIVRLRGEDLAIERFGPGKLARLVNAKRARECFGDGIFGDRLAGWRWRALLRLFRGQAALFAVHHPHRKSFEPEPPGRLRLAHHIGDGAINIFFRIRKRPEIGHADRAR